MRKLLSLLLSGALLSASLTALSSPSALAETTFITCTDLVTQKRVVLRADQKSCKPLDATAIWHLEQSDSPAHSGAGYADLRTCTSKRTQFDYQLLKSKCAKYQNTNDYWHTVIALEIPIITTSSARGYDSAAFTLAATAQNTDAPIAYYLITNNKTGQINKVSPNNAGELSLSNLSSLTSYTFTIAAVSVDGTSPSSSITPVITTGAIPVVVVAPTAAPLATPAFTLSSASESKTVNNAITGYTVTSTGGAVASYSISPAAPAGLTFSTSTGLLSGTPTSVASATAYTITATNTSGSATRTFTMTVTAIVYSVGDRGPGGGIVYYVSADYFTSAGSTCNTNCMYLEVAPSGWNNGGVFRSDPLIQWSTDTTTVTGQDRTPANQSNFAGEKVNWAIGKGFSNTSLIRPTSAIAAPTLSYGATDGSTGQWFIPSMNELNELCKYSRGQTTGVVTVACNTSGALKTGISDAFGGFVDSWYWSSSEENEQYVYGLRKVVIDHDAKDDTSFFRPVRAI